MPDSVICRCPSMGGRLGPRWPGGRPGYGGAPGHVVGDQRVLGANGHRRHPARAVDAAAGSTLPSAADAIGIPAAAMASGAFVMGMCMSAFPLRSRGIAQCPADGNRALEGEGAERWA